MALTPSRMAADKPNFANGTLKNNRVASERKQIELKVPLAGLLVWPANLLGFSRRLFQAATMPSMNSNRLRFANQKTLVETTDADAK
jgi:hypothetical protein